MDVRVRVAEGKKLYWRGRDRVGGEIIEVPEKEARLIVAVKKGTLVEATKVPDPKPRPTQELEGRSLKAETESRGSGGGTLTEQPRRYKRRDMKAEE